MLFIEFETAVLKNIGGSVLALHGLGFKDNAKAAIIARGLAEITV